MDYVKITKGFGEAVLIAVENFENVDTNRVCFYVFKVHEILYSKYGKYSKHKVFPNGDGVEMLANEHVNPIISLTAMSEKEYRDEINKVALASDIIVVNPIPEHYEVATSSNVDILYVPKKGDEEGYDVVTFGDVIGGQVIPDKRRIYYNRKNKMVCIDVKRWGDDFVFDYEASTPEKSIWHCVL